MVTDYAVIDNGVVVNIIVIDDADQAAVNHFAARHGALVPLRDGTHGTTIHPTAGRQGGPGIGWTYNTTARRFTPQVAVDPGVQA